MINNQEECKNIQNLIRSCLKEFLFYRRIPSVENPIEAMQLADEIKLHLIIYGIDLDNIEVKISEKQQKMDIYLNLHGFGLVEVVVSFDLDIEL